MSKNGYNRREFLKTAAIGSAALSLGCITKPGKHIPKIGLQLYTLRSIIFDDFTGTIKNIADMGYTGVETWGGLSQDMDLKAVAKILKDAGLQVFAGHCDLPIDENRDFALRMADAYQMDRLIYWGGSKEQLFSNNEQIKNTIETYNKISEDLKTMGIKFGIHNHSWEFEETEAGIIPYYYYKEHLNKDFFFEIDTYWVQSAGYDAAKAVKDFGSRAPLLHIKDGTTKHDDKHVAIGTGAMDIPSIAKAGGDNIEWMVVEFDDFDVDIFKALKQSYDYLTKNEFAKGNI